MSMLSTIRQRLTSTSSCSLCQRRSAHKLVEVELLQDVPNLGLRGTRIPIAPGRARNNLIPQGKALLVVGGKSVSNLRDMLKRESLVQRFTNPASLAAMLAKNRTSLNNGAMDGELDEVIDPLAPLLLLESNLLSSLSILPILQFYRLPINPVSSSTLPGQNPTTTSSSSKEIFGSVSLNDLIVKCSEYGVLIPEESGNVVARLESIEGKEVEKGRIKGLGRFKFTVELKTIKEIVSVDIEVLPEV